jgi:hypothetical protein
MTNFIFVDAALRVDDGALIHSARIRNIQIEDRDVGSGLDQR